MSVSAHTRFLKMLGWEGEELERFLPQWIYAANYLKLDENDILRGLDYWLPTHWDISLLSTRKLIAAYIREVVELSKVSQYLQEGHKVIYTYPTSSHACVYANRIAGEGRLHVFHADFLITTINQAFFGKMTTGVDSGSCMSGRCHHCALNAARVDFSASGQMVAPTVLWSWGLQCNEASKTTEMINCLQGNEWKDVLLTIPHDAPLGSVEAEDDYRVEYLAAEIRHSQKNISEITGIEVRDEHLREAIRGYLDYMYRLDALTDLVVTADPQPLSGNELNLMGLCVQVCFDTGLEYINDALDTAIEEAKARIAQGIGVVPKGSPKLACHFQPIHLPWLDRTFMQNGVSIALGRIFTRAQWLEDAVDDDDVYKTAARHCLLCPNVVNMENEAEYAVKVLQQYHFDGALYGFYSYDRWVGALHKAMIRTVEEKTGIPHYYLEGEFWGSESSTYEDRLPIIRSICNSLKISKL